MTVIALFLVGALLALSMSLITVSLLRPHLRKLLAELCGSGARAGFWVAACSLCIFLLGLLAGTVDWGYPAGSNPAMQPVFFGLVTQLRACLIGLLGSIMFTAWLLLGWICRFEQRTAESQLLRAVAGNSGTGAGSGRDGAAAATSGTGNDTPGWKGRVLPANVS